MECGGNPESIRRKHLGAASGFACRRTQQEQALATVTQSGGNARMHSAVPTILVNSIAAQFPGVVQCRGLFRTAGSTIQRFNDSTALVAALRLHVLAFPPGPLTSLARRLQPVAAPRK